MEHLHALKCSYMSLTQLSRVLTRSDLKSPELFAECSNRLGKVASGVMINSNGNDFSKAGPHPSNWGYRGCLETEVGPWRHLEPEAALEVCQWLLKRADEEPLTVIRDAGGAPDFAATFDTGEDAVNTDQLALLDVARWIYSRHPREHRFAIPPFATVDISDNQWGPQQFFWKSEEHATRLLWDALHPEYGFTVLYGRASGYTVVIAFHTIGDALEMLRRQLAVTPEELLCRVGNEFGLPVGQFRPLVQEAQQAIIEVEWRRVMTEQLVREVKP